MIISKKHRIVFVQVARTGSSFTGNFMIHSLEGESILKKHSTYEDFLEIATPDEKKYHVLIGKRNPISRVTTQYVRQQKRNGKLPENLEDLRTGFDAFFRENYLKSAKEDHLISSYPYADTMIRQENLSDDLGAFLEKLNIKGLEVPPWKRKSRKKLEDYTLYYTASLISLAIDVFQDEMKQLEYEVPAWCYEKMK